MAAVIDHVEPFSRGGAHDDRNFVTACNKCNARKNSLRTDRFATKSPRRPVRGRYGEPTCWDGLSTLFVLMVQHDRSAASTSELAWYSAFSLTASSSPVQSSGPPCDDAGTEPVVLDDSAANVNWLRSLRDGGVDG
ncbi:MAG: HNH endonuclease [Candidatus Rokuibacteriota bacterium]